MAKSPIRIAAEQVLARFNLYPGRVFASELAGSTKVKFTGQRTTSLRMMHEMCMATGCDEYLNQKFKYRYAHLSSPKHGFCHGLVVGCTNDLNHIKRLCSVGPTIYTADGMYMNQKHTTMKLGDFTTLVFNWNTFGGAELEFKNELLTVDLHQAREAACKRKAEAQQAHDQAARTEREAVAADTVARIRAAELADKEAEYDQDADEYDEAADIAKLLSLHKASRKGFRVIKNLIELGKDHLSADAVEALFDNCDQLAASWRAIGIDITAG